MSKRFWIPAVLALGSIAIAVPQLEAAQTQDEVTLEEHRAEDEAWRKEHLEKDHAWKMKWSNGFKLESSDGQFKLKFGGRIQADYQFVSFNAVEGLQDALELHDGFEFRRARLFFEGTIYERVFFKAQYDFAGGDADFKDVFVGLDFDGWRLLFGHNKEAFSLGELTSSKYIAFLERASATTTFAPSRNSGINALGRVGDRFNWGLGVFYDSDDFGVSTDEDDKNITGRVVYRPYYEDAGKRLFHVGVGATRKDRAETIRFRARPEAHQSNRFLDTGDFEADSALVYNLELAGVYNRLWVQGEYYNAGVSSQEFDDPTFDGWYLQTGYFITDDHRRYKTKSGSFDRQKPASNWGRSGGSGAWEVVARWATTDLNDGGVRGREADSLSVGVNWYPNPATRMMFNYIRSEGRDGDGVDVGTADIFLLRWQVDF